MTFHTSAAHHVLLSLFLQIEDSGYISLINVNSSVNTSDIAALLASTPYTAQDFPLNSSNTILSGVDWSAVVAPYWYDVDTRGNGSGRIYYKDVTRGTDADLIGEIDSLATPHLCGFTSTWALIVTWDHVGYFSERSDKVQSQIVIVYMCTRIPACHRVQCHLYQHTPVWSGYFPSLAENVSSDIHSTYIIHCNIYVCTICHSYSALSVRYGSNTKRTITIIFSVTMAP